MEPDDLPRRFFTALQVAQMLSVDEGEVDALLESGELRGIRIGASPSWRVEATALDAYLEAKYEESRRAALWRGFDFGGIADFRRRGDDF